MFISFICFLALFLGIGLWASKRAKNTVDDYLLAGQNTKPWLIGLSFFATENSGFMFIGFIGMSYAIGLSSLWILIGWYLGEVLILWLTSRQIRGRAAETKSLTYSGLLSLWTGGDYKLVRSLSALVIIIFLSIYAAAQLSAGGKALNVLADWDLSTGAIIGFLLVLVYCFVGGLRASIWTDAAQAIVMLVSLILIVGVGLHTVGGLSSLIDQLNQSNPDLLDMMAGSYKYGMIGFIAGWFVSGIGVLGQPQIVVRFMAIDKVENARKAVLWYAGLVSVLTILCVTAALCARVILPELAETDPELALPTLSANLMPGVFSGLFLAGLFAASISSADSQILSSSAALTRDLFPKYGDRLLFSRLGTLIVGLFALSIVLWGGETGVFKLATVAWSTMASALAPLVMIYAWGKKPTEIHALLMMIGGALVSTAWEQAGLSAHIYNALPGVLSGLVIYFIGAPIFKQRG